MKCVSVADYGAKDNGELQTKAFQQAIDDCFSAGAGVVIVPKGTYFIGSIRLRSHVTLHLLSGARLVGSRNPEDYFIQFEDELEPYERDMLSKDGCTANQGKLAHFKIYGHRFYNGLIKVYEATDVAIIGDEGSEIDGNDCYDALGEEQYRGPHCISVAKSSNITLKGYCIVNSSNWAHSIWESKNIELSDVSVRAGHDGCHLRFCQNIHIHDCDFATGDDCVAGYSNDNVLIENCSMNTACSAFRFGPTNAIIQNCRVYGPPKHLMRWMLPLEDKIAGVHDVSNRHGWETMLSFFTYASVEHYTKGRPGNDNILFRNITVENTDRFIHYNFSGNEPWQSGCPLVGVRFENITAVGMKHPLTVYGVKDDPIAIELKDVSVRFADGYEDLPLIEGAYFKRISLENVEVKNAKGKALIRSWSKDVTPELHHVVFSDCYEIFDYPQEPFTCKPI